MPLPMMTLYMMLSRLSLWPCDTNCEVSFLLCPEIRSTYNIKAYFRFKDDLFFIIGGDREIRRQFYDELKTRSGFFKLKWEAIHRTGVDFLDLHIFKGPRWHSTGVLDYYVKVKTSALGIMLSSSSAHHPSVHMTWPRARVRRSSPVVRANTWLIFL